MYFMIPVVWHSRKGWTMDSQEQWLPRLEERTEWIGGAGNFWRGLLRVPWIARRSNQSILKEISPEYSLEGLMLKLKLHYLGHLTQRTDSLEKTLMLGKIGGRRRKGWLNWRFWEQWNSFVWYYSSRYI